MVAGAVSWKALVWFIRGLLVSDNGDGYWVIREANASVLRLILAVNNNFAER
jgi:hypothetical protein